MRAASLRLSRISKQPKLVVIGSLLACSVAGCNRSNGSKPAAAPASAKIAQSAGTILRIVCDCDEPLRERAKAAGRVENPATVGQDGIGEGFTMPPQICDVEIPLIHTYRSDKRLVVYFKVQEPANDSLKGGNMSGLWYFQGFPVRVDSDSRANILQVHLRGFGHLTDGAIRSKAP